MPNSEARQKATNKYNKKAYNQLALRFRKDDPILDLLKDAARKTDCTINEYVKKALCAQFVADGLNFGEVGTDNSMGNVGGESDTIAMLRRQKGIIEKMRREEEEKQAFRDNVEE